MTTCKKKLRKTSKKKVRLEYKVIVRINQWHSATTHKRKVPIYSLFDILQVVRGKSKILSIYLDNKKKIG